MRLIGLFVEVKGVDGPIVLFRILLLFWYPFGVQGHELIDTRHTIVLAEFFMNLAAVRLVDPGIPYRVIIKVGFLL